MKTYKVETTWSGYCRGMAAYSVKAESPEEAKRYWYEGEEIYKEIIRDDTESEVDSVEEIVENDPRPD